MQKLIWWLFLISFFVCGYSGAYISEIGFVGDEFVEIYSDSFLNLTNSSVVDDSGKINSLNLVHNVNDSNFYLVVGGNFVLNNNVDDFNCSVYVTDKTQVSNGGLKSGGESFSIGGDLFDFDLGDEDYDFMDYESLNYNYNDSEFVVLNSSICSFPIFEDIFIDNITYNDSSNISSNVTDEVLSPNSSCGNIGLSIILKEELVLDKFYFKFVLDDFGSGDSDSGGDVFDLVGFNYSLNYWVEDYSGDVVKDSRDTKSLAWKSFSPKGATNIYRFYGDLSYFVDNLTCSVMNSSVGYFYSDYVPVVFSSKSDTKSSSVSDNSDLSTEPYVKFLNLDSVLNGSLDILEYEIYRGNSRKYVVNFFVGSKNILKLKLDKFSKVSGKVKVDFELGDFFRVIGFGYDDKYNFSISDDFGGNSYKNINLTKRGKQFFEVLGLRQNGSNVLFNVSSNVNNLEGSCYLNLVRTKVSDKVNLSLVGYEDFIGILNVSSDKITDLNSSLRFICKYRSFGLKSWKYYSRDFNFSKSFNYDSLILSNSFFSNYEDFDLVGIDVSRSVDPGMVEDEYGFDLDSFLDLNLDVGGLNGNVYESKNYGFILDSVGFVSFGAIILLVVMIFFW